MAQEHLKNSVLPRALSDVVADLADLIQKEIQLAKAEVSANISTKLHAGLWMGIAAGLGVVAGLLVIQGIVFGIASFGIPMHWSCAILAAVMGAAAALAYYKAKADAREELTPRRTIHQMRQDIATVKEHLT